MPFAALAFALFVLAGSVDPADVGSSSKPLLASQPPASLLLAVDDEVYGDRDDGDEDDGAYSEDPDFNYGYEDDDEDDSAHGPGDDEDDGWDIDDIARSERA